MKAYYGSRFSPNMTKTPEGFLICHNVPIARTGWYDYLGEEIGADDKQGQIVKVYRSPEEVFNKSSMASFEGKPSTDEHPSNWVTPDNASSYLKGTVQNVRKGVGEENDLLIADLIIYDPVLISEIEAGKREVSCGYDCIYEDNGDGTYSQRQICGNHVAVVNAGRAGDRVAIKDSSMKGENKNMGGKKTQIPRKHSSVTDFLVAIGLKKFATDAEPEEIMDAMEAMAEENKDSEEENPVVKQEEKKSDDEAPNEIQALNAKVDKLTEIVTKLVESDKKVHEEVKPEDALDAVIAELESGKEDENDEESVTLSPEQMNDDEGPVSDPSDRPENPIPGADNAYRLQALKAMKPVIAAISDPVEKKKACDALLASMKTTQSKGKNIYSSIVKGQKKGAKDTQTKDNEKDFSQLGQEWAKKYNPHYKEKQ